MSVTAIHSKRIGFARAFGSELLSAEDALDLALQDGERLSISRKYRVVRVGDWVVKHARFASGLGMLRLSLGPQRRRRAMRAAQYLAARGVRCPALGGYVEFGAAGIVTSTATISRYLDGAAGIREHALTLRTASEDDIRAFLSRLAQAVDTIASAKAYHADLAGKNVMTVNGDAFYFVDLDCVRIRTTATPAERLKNVVQLLDTFYDLWPAAVLRDFALMLAPQDEAGERWVDRVFSGLDKRITDRHAFRLLALEHMEEIFGKLNGQPEQS